MTETNCWGERTSELAHETVRIGCFRVIRIPVWETTPRVVERAIARLAVSYELMPLTMPCRNVRP